MVPPYYDPTRVRARKHILSELRDGAKTPSALCQGQDEGAIRRSLRALKQTGHIVRTDTDDVQYALCDWFFGPPKSASEPAPVEVPADD